MKKLVLLIAVCFLAGSAAFAQFSYGLRGGLNLTSMTNDDDAAFKASFYVGGFAEWRLNSVLAISPELYYSRQGAALDDSALNVLGLDKSRLRVNYINLPVLAKLYAVGDALSFDVGPQVGFMTNAVAWIKADGATATTDADDLFNTVDVSFALGATYNFDHVFFQARYNLGLTKMYDSSSYADSKNSVLQFGVGYRF